MGVGVELFRRFHALLHPGGSTMRKMTGHGNEPMKVVISYAGDPHAPFLNPVCQAPQGA
jgi:hypothetical protein